MDGKILNLQYHNRRFNYSRLTLFGVTGGADLSSLIHIPDEMKSGCFRCKVLYRQKIEKIEFIPCRERIVKSLKLITADNIEYSYKYADRKQLESLFEKRCNCDEILIVKNGFVTDTSISNIVLRRTDGSWITPDTPLLNGTMRMFLLETGQITEMPVRPEHLTGFTGAKMINCMMDLKTSVLIHMDRII